MAFIKRSTTSPVNVKVGQNIHKCLKCGVIIVNKTGKKLCQNCDPSTCIFHDDGSPEENLPNFDSDRE